MQTADAVVRLQALDGEWETCGVDRYRGISPEGIRLEANQWGADTASFTLNRDQGAVWPDLSAFTPVEIEIGGVTVWDGFVSQTPSTELDGGSINVQCKGWQYHLDDDSSEKVWVASMFSDWKDARELQATRINYFRPGTTVSIGDGAISLGWAKDSTIQLNTFAGVIFDAGPDNKIKAVSMSWSVDTGTNLGSSVNLKMYALASDSLSSIHSGVAASGMSSGIAMGGLGTTTANKGGTFSTSGRYVLVGLKFASGTTNTAGLDYLVKISKLSVAYDASYINTTTNIITGPVASQVVKDVLPSAPLLDQATDDIYDTTFTIPHFSSLNGGKTPREYIDAVNSYHNYIAKVQPGRSLLFKPRPSAPTVAIGNWGGSEFEDASANSGDEIYNKVVVEGSGPDGLPLRVSRVAANVPLKSSTVLFTDQSLCNGDFSSSTTGWSVVNSAGTAVSSALSSLSATTTDAINGTSGKWTFVTAASGGDYYLRGSFSSTTTFNFKAGVSYTAQISLRTFANSYPYVSINPTLKFGTSTDSAMLATADYDWTPNPNRTYSASVSWTPTADRVSNTVYLWVSVDQWFFDNFFLVDNDYLIVDDWSISYSSPTLVDRRGFTRTKRLQVESVVTTETAKQLGDIYLASKVATPLKGSVKVSGSGARDYLSGAAVHPSQLLLEVGERLHLSHRTDPDTGAVGRDGDIAGVSYDHDNETASVSIDSQRNRFENLLSRLSVVTGTALNR